MEDTEGKVAGLFGRTVEEILDLAQKHKHTFRQVIVVAMTSEGYVKLFKTRMPYKDMALMNKMVDVSLTADIQNGMENLT